MAIVHFNLKEYQQAALDNFQAYVQYAANDGADVAYYRVTRNPYVAAPTIATGTPYVCIRIPTGGGKTIVAAHSIGVTAKEYLQASNPMVLWLVPSEAILNQTLNALKNLEHPYRVALTKDFGHNVSVMTKAEALCMSRADAEDRACIIVSTIQSFRREKDNGKINEDGLKVYQDSGALMDHFTGLNDDQIARVDTIEGTSRPIYSLANLLKLHRPMVIVDEAHNARTSLSFDTLSRFDPSLILELTATPQTKHEPAKDLYPSNVLYSVSAAELKAEQMIKMPIKLTTDRDWQKVIGIALDCQTALEEAAKAEQSQTGEYLRPIILLQAQSAKKTDSNRLTYAVLEEFLKNDKLIPENHIAVHTGGRHDLDTIENIEDPQCSVRIIITVKKLREGWDCPFAYIMCSVAEQTSATAVEQILGRVLRMPKAKLKNRSALNEAYAFVASPSFDETARQLKDGLVDGAGFNRAEVSSFVEQQPDLGLKKIADETEHESEPIDSTEISLEEVIASFDKLPATVRTRISINESSRTFSFKGSMTREARNQIILSVAKSPKATKIVDTIYAKSNYFALSDTILDEKKSPFIVPLLGYNKQGKLELFSQEHFLDLPWRLDECDASSIVQMFNIVKRSETGEISISDQGEVEIHFAERLQADLLYMVQEPAWDIHRLANWLDRSIDHPDVTKPSATMFISNAIEALIQSRITLDLIVRNRYDLKRSLRELINKLRRDRQTGEYDALFATDAQKFATSSSLSIVFDEQTYAFKQPYIGATKFSKHYMKIIGDLRAEGEEFECAVYIDRMDEVESWIRNIDGKSSSFWLQLPGSKFYPDFIVKLKDERILVVEYKGAHLYESEKTKRQIGEVWADASNGKCLFCMPTNRDFDLIKRTINN